MTALVDAFSRRIRYLRLSLTDRCDLRCVYCMPEAMQFMPRNELLTLEEIHDLALGFIARGIEVIRLTGGEPLVRRDAIDLVEWLGRELGASLKDLTLTTNGIALPRFAARLAKAGVRRINVSLDTLDREAAARIARRDVLPQVIAGIEAARAEGIAVRVNAVALQETPPAELVRLIEWAHASGSDVALIEVMPLGEVGTERADQFSPLGAVRRILAERFTLAPSAHRTAGPARYWDVAETGHRIGFITPLTDNFCDGCNRVRVSAEGQMHPCLGGSEAVDLRAALRSGRAGALDAAIDAAMKIKPLRHHFAIERGGAPALARTMSVTGG
ncbi:GTP 3',8-cyclase MoaA [Parablastomonas sp. CN1-191]|uniref:GTP 3',8-cyclase MoaA n=1 Tax=Parablastomonas sp. CN1-191 TaxID=3400908 RepID=UPI003BF7A0E1